MRKTESITEIKTLLKDVYEMSGIKDQIQDMIKEGCKTEDDIELCSYLIHLRDKVEKIN
jgi:hypothetical protein